MPRPPRQDYPGAWHHIINRGAGQNDIFQDDWDRNCFIDALVGSAIRTECEIHCYCLMSNHYHLLVCSADGRLSDFMKFACGRFVKLTNKRRRSDGPSFKGRFWSTEISGDAHLIQASRYIHLNPVNARLSVAPEEWRWSSAAAYVGKCQPPDWLRIRTILSMVDPSSQTSKYAQYIREGVDEATMKRYAEAE